MIKMWCLFNKLGKMWVLCAGCNVKAHRLLATNDTNGHE